MKKNLLRGQILYRSPDPLKKTASFVFYPERHFLSPYKDAVSGMNNVGDYSATFLPILIGPADCRDKNNKTNPPIAIAWASPARNHFIPILPVSSANGTILPVTVIPPVWLAPQNHLEDYMTYRHTTTGVRGVLLGGGIEFSDTYVIKLIKSMRQGV